MGGKELGLSLLCFSSLYIFASSSSVQVNKSSEFLQKINLGDKVIYGEDRVIYGNKIEGSFGHGSANGGGSTGSGENGNNGGTRSPNTQGGTNFIPVYVAGAANNHHTNNHHGSGYRNLSGVKIIPLFATILTSLLAQLNLLI